MTETANSALGAVTTDYDPASSYYCADFARVHARTQSDYLAAEINARVAYGQMPWRERLVTPPPPGWPGGHVARLLAWARHHIAQREPT